jgi:hypothetical protein
MNLNRFLLFFLARNFVKAVTNSFNTLVFINGLMDLQSYISLFLIERSISDILALFSLPNLIDKI